MAAGKISGLKETPLAFKAPEKAIHHFDAAEISVFVCKFENERDSLTVTDGVHKWYTEASLLSNCLTTWKIPDPYVFEYSGHERLPRHL